MAAMTVVLPPAMTATWATVLRYAEDPAPCWTPVVATQGQPRTTPWATRARIAEVVPYLGANARDLTAEQRAERYRERLDGAGIEVIAARLHAQYERYGRRPLVVIARDDDRATLTGWLHEQTGHDVPVAVGLDVLSIRQTLATTR